jgi:hypothetical protein
LFFSEVQLNLFAEDKMQAASAQVKEQCLEVLSRSDIGSDSGEVRMWVQVAIAKLVNSTIQSGDLDKFLLTVV